MPVYQHYILTRFNYGLYSNQRKDKNKQPVNNDQWMEHRLQLFDKYCLPSVKAQIDQTFKWLVLFDRKTPVNYLKKIKTYQTTYPKFIPVYSNDYFLKGVHAEGYNAFVKYLNKHLAKDTEYLITTRLDNDDALNINATSIIHQYFNFQKSSCLIFMKGFFLTKNQLFLTNTLNNPFLTMFEKIERKTAQPGFKTVMYTNHRFLSRYAKIDKYETEPMWVQVVHDRNLLNKTKGKPVELNLLQQNFTLCI